MGLDVLMLLISLGLVLLASVLFTNAIEILGERLGMHQGAVGSILAAVGTALPETVIPVIAIVWFHEAKSMDVAVGAIAGAPFMLATLAFFVTGAGVLVYSFFRRRTIQMHVDSSVISRDLGFFLVVYTVAVLTTFAHDFIAIRWIVAIALLLSYVYYVHITLRSEAREMEDVDRLYLAIPFRAASHLPLVVTQIVAALIIMVYGAHMFVKYVEAVSTLAGISPLILSLLITPIATELPEKCNSIIWIGRSKDTLALGNITGAMVFQSCFPVAFGIVGTQWDLCQNGYVTLVSAILALLSALTVFLWIRKRPLNPWVLLVGGPVYAILMFFIFFTRG